MQAIDQALAFDNRFVRELPADPDESVRPRHVLKSCYSRVKPTPVAAPKLIAHATEVAEILGLSDEQCASPEFAQVFGGNRVLEGMDPFAMCYGGHQFGNWAGQLGDGRAINLGQVERPGGARWTLQLKGAGPTPYSRNADGLAVMRSSVREFLCSEAMHHLGVPTTRALSLVATGEEVERDMFYDGHPKMEPGAVVCRVSRSFVRFGSFEIHASRRDEELLRALADHVIRFDYPELLPDSPTAQIGVDTYVAWFHAVARRTAELMVHWQRVGFVHGVMNTDNMSILGETIDYGPYGWLEDFDPAWTPNTTDAQGRRYRFGSQGEIAYWNLSRLASALVPLVGDVAPLQQAIEEYPRVYWSRWETMMVQKLGLASYEVSSDEPLLRDLIECLQLAETDMTIFYRQLALVDLDGMGETLPDELQLAFYDEAGPDAAAREKWMAWLTRYRERVASEGVEPAERARRMNAVNPRYVLRNSMAQLAIDKAEQGDGSLVMELLDLLRRPYDEQPERAEWYAKRPEWARTRPGCSMLSCSS